MKNTEKLNELIKKQLQGSKESLNKIDNEQIKKLNEKLSGISRKLDISPETIKAIQDSLEKIVKNSKLVDIRPEAIYWYSEYSIIYTLRALADSIKELTEKEKSTFKAYTLLSEAGFAPHIETNIDFLKSINETEKIENTRSRRKAITELAIRYYNEKRITTITNKWYEHSLLKKRIPLLSSAINAHIEQEYILSIPVLLTQIEGIVMDGFYHVGQYNHDRLALYLKDLIENANTKFNSLNKNVFDSLFNNVMMVTFEKGISEYSKSRHSILHGASYRYGKSDYSLKLILFIDMIIKMFNYCSYDSISEYHIVGCKELKGRARASSISSSPFTNFYYNKEKRRYIEKLITFYQSEDEAINAGKTACPKCIKPS